MNFILAVFFMQGAFAASGPDNAVNLDFTGGDVQSGSVTIGKNTYVCKGALAMLLNPVTADTICGDSTTKPHPNGSGQVDVLAPAPRSPAISACTSDSGTINGNCGAATTGGAPTQSGI